MLKLTGLFLSLVAALAMAGAAFVLGSGERRLDALEDAVAAFSPYTLDLRDAQLDLRPFRFEAGLLQLRRATAEQAAPALLTAQNLSLAMPLGKLLRGTPGEGQFRARNVTYFLEEAKDSEPVDLEGLLRPLGWLPERVDIGSVHIMSRAENVWIFPLLNLSARRTPEGSLALITEAHIGSRVVVLEALADWLLAPGGGHWVNLRSAIFGPNDESRLLLEGRADADGADLAYSLALRGEYARINDFLLALDPDAVSLRGNLTIDGTLEGDLDGFHLDVKELLIAEGEAYEFEAEGTIREDFTTGSTITVTATGYARRLEGLLPLPPALAAVIEDTRLRVTLDGSLGAPRLAEVGLVLTAPGGTRLSLENPALALQIDALDSLDSLAGTDLDLEMEADDLPALLAAFDLAPDLPLPQRGTLKGRLASDEGEFLLEAASIEATADTYALEGSGRVVWRGDALSAPQFDLTLTPMADGGQVTASGSIASLADFHGAVIDLHLDGLRPAALPRLDEATAMLPATTALTGRTRLLRAATVSRFQDLEVTTRLNPDLAISAQGSASLEADGLAADLTLELEGDAAGFAEMGLPMGPDEASGRLRLRPTYATLLAELARGGSAIQAVVNAELDDFALTSLGVDFYSRDLVVEDFLPAPDAHPAPGPDDEPGVETPDDASSWVEALPTWPLHLTMRADELRSAHTSFSGVSLAVTGTADTYLLEHLDARYRGGELILRGALDRRADPLALSLAGQGIAIPLGELTRDLGLQESVTGNLSLRGGLTTRGAVAGDWTRHLAGSIALAAKDTTVSGPAYDLLMSNILAWIVEGAGEKTTTFDCTMARFDIKDGVAQSDSLFIETPRLLATGKGRIDMPGNRIDVRIEPRSKTRTFQFPSAVRIGGALDDPEVSVSELQATVDLSAQALLLLPSLTLKLFGIGQDSDAPQPCDPVLS